ncbi:PREDICTED: potassium/sodium hyperpolarization-activated cyclic nucleotide-gated channel 2 isoform X7 [Polistes dominula]|uniref:Potassium/sodium hyperpolarization-activated cyclic nucleotide-gated channel 2 isoform X7 n=1 Tax=Polistes dominula TaxID=743375 RepID=A0ABM1HY05_POLDO|nr:PREDICTED: potassium/sodium hyperpolarization-activated cyclic nucleotide-gated channel 2 isoform X7 [Polistes dominula]
MNYKGSGKVHFGVDDVSLYGTPKEEPGPGLPGQEVKQSFLKNQLQALFQPTDNKLAMKLFGSKKALMKERIRQKAAGHWVIHPCSSFRFYWDLCMLLLLVANLIILPVAISFFNDDLSTRWIAFNCLSDTIFLIDIVVNFRTGIMQQDNAEQVILDPKLIAKHYLRTWFFLDLISSIPLDYIFLIFNQFQDFSESFQILHAGRALRILRLAKLLSLVRLLRLSRLVRYVSQWEEVYIPLYQQPERHYERRATPPQPDRTSKVCLPSNPETKAKCPFLIKAEKESGVSRREIRPTYTRHLTLIMVYKCNLLLLAAHRTVCVETSAFNCTTTC